MAQEFEGGHIKAPLHLAGGNERELIRIFQDVRKGDWILGSWRSHFHCLLAGVPRESLKRAILEGRSIALTFPEQRVLCSAIVGGIAPIAVGLAWAIKRARRDEAVWVFVGDMTWETGIVQESMKYAAGHSLDVRWIVEDNHIGGAGVPTQEVWGSGRAAWVDNYEYELTRPFVGVGKWIPL